MVEIHIELTNQCLLRCKHCSSNANTVTQISMIKTAEIYAFIKQVDDHELKVIFTGGEPLLYGITELADLFRALHTLESKKIQLGLFTTGIIEGKPKLRFISEAEIATLKKHGLNFAFFSIYSRRKEVHEYITDEETFNLTINTIKEFGKQGIISNVNYVLSKFSVLDEVFEDFNFLKTLGVNEIRILRLIKHGRAVENWEDIGISLHEQHEIIDGILQNTQSNVSVSGMPQLTSCQGFDDNFCHAGSKKFYIDICGDIFPCACVKKK